MQKILVNSEITSSIFANCEDKLDLLSVSSRIHAVPNAHCVQLHSTTHLSSPSNTNNSNDLSDDYIINENEDDLELRISSNQDVGINQDVEFINADVNCLAKRHIYHMQRST